jgi:hypothetical protein
VSAPARATPARRPYRFRFTGEVLLLAHTAVSTGR